MRRSKRNLALAMALLVTASWTWADEADRHGKKPKDTEDYSSDVAFRWFETMYDVVKVERTPPPPASRNYGLAAVTLYEAVVPGSEENRSLVRQLNGLTKVPKPKGHKEYHWPTVANTAMADTLRGLYPTASQASLDLINSLEAELAVQYQDEVPRLRYQRSVAQGRAVANAILKWAATDGFKTLNNCAYTPPVGPGLWEPTLPGFLPPLQPCWGQIRTMVMISGEECAPPEPPEYSTDVDSEFYANAYQVYVTQLNSTQEQTVIANYWADGLGATGTPPGHSISMMSGFVREDNMNLMQAAEGYARVGMAVHDAFIGCWNAKYLFNLLRPVTYIRNVIDGAWTPLLVTPNFPEYVSGHSMQSGAVSVVMTDFLGVRSFTDTTRSRHDLLPDLADRSFDSIDEAAEEAAVSRLYGGIHYPFGNNNGLDQGHCIGQAIVDRIDFRKDED